MGNCECLRSENEKHEMNMNRKDYEKDYESSNKAKAKQVNNIHWIQEEDEDAEAKNELEDLIIKQNEKEVNQLDCANISIKANDDSHDHKNGNFSRTLQAKSSDLNPNTDNRLKESLIVEPTEPKQLDRSVLSESDNEGCKSILTIK